MTTPDFPSPEAAEAYKRAQAEIAKVKADGGSRLWLNGAHGFSALTHLPSKIVDLEGLGTLDLSQTQITDDGLRHIAGMEGLGSLNLFHTQITDDGLRHIAGMEGLRILELSQTQITDDGLRNIAGMKGLEDLHLFHTQITDDGLRNIAGMEGLGHLSLSQTQITDDGLRHIAGMGGLGYLSLSHTQITDDGLRHIAGMEGLRTLDLSQTQIGLPGLQHLARRDGVLQDADGNYGWLYLEGTPALDDDGLRVVYEGMKDTTAGTKAVLDYARDWVPPGPDYPPLPEAPVDGPKVAVGRDRKVDYTPAATAPDFPITDQQRTHHTMVLNEIRAAQMNTSAGHNFYGRLYTLYARAEAELAKGPEGLDTDQYWAIGNRLRIYLRKDDRRGDDPDNGTPRLDADRSEDLEAIVALHNTYASLRPDLADLDHRQLSPDQKAALALNDRDLDQVIAVFNDQIELVVDRLREDITALWEEGRRGNEAAMQMDLQTLAAVLNEVIAEAAAEQKPGLRSDIAADLRSTAVGTVAVGAAHVIAPEAALAYTDLMVLLEPHLDTVLTTLFPGQDLGQTVAWIKKRVQDRLSNT